jgi:demethylmenaquinone methyltransferase/2-methoxy-6-polyprenyl-1,4-benzoquinol methylase
MEKHADMIPHIELRGFRARFYDQLILIGTLGLYNPLIKKIIMDMEIQPADKILDMGAGTGKNELLMQQYLSGRGHITACEISAEMKKKFHKQCDGFTNITLMPLRIERPLPFRDTFDKVFLSFVIHGFTQDKRILILENAFNALKPGGKIFIFDWNEFRLEDSGPLMRLFMNYIECKQAKDFISRNFSRVLTDIGFSGVKQRLYAWNKFRLLSADKLR